ncbi:MAG: glycosyltransferase family 39 protein, partial [Chloroflexi bacterium]|nr:glycosyltransferase family 39 protein [Chloroflexota bacterium]
MEHINNRKPLSDNRLTFWFLLLVLVTAVLRFYNLSVWSFWIEEHHSLRHTAALDSIEKVIQNTRPLYYLISKPALTYWGVSEWSARIVPAFLGIISVPLLYALTKKLFGFFPAFLSALLLALSPWHIYWSQNARFYALLLPLYTVSVFAFYWGVETDRFRYIILSFIALALAVISHSIAVLLIPIFLIYSLLLKFGPFAKPPGLRPRNIIPFIALPLVGYLVFEALLIFYLDNTPFIVEIYQLFFDEATASYVGYGNPYVMVTAVIYRIGVPLAYLSLPGVFYLLRDKSRIGLCLALGAYFPLATFTILTLFAA